MFNDFFQLVQDLLLTLQTKTVRFMKVIHFITDDKFLNSTIEMFEEIEGLNNRYLIISDEETPFHFLTSTKVEKIKTSDINNVILDPTSTDVIVIHNLSSLPCEYIKEIHPKIKVVWFSWGFDTYNNQKPQFPLIPLKHQIKPKTMNLRYRLRFWNESLRLFFKNTNKKILIKRHIFIDSIHRIDYYSGVFPIEYDFLKKHPFFRAKQILFSYPFEKDTIKKENLYHDIFPKGKTIQIGNCGKILSNHRNTFWLLQKMDLKDRKILVPLSYGGNNLYRSTVYEKGRQLFGDKFIPLTSFIELDKYIELTKSVSVAIYNIIRQMAVGNILLNLWNGAKVFLPEDSINYKHFKSLGYKVFSLEKDLNQKGIDTLLSDEEIIENRKKILKYHSYIAIKEKTIKSFQLIESEL